MTCGINSDSISDTPQSVAKPLEVIISGINGYIRHTFQLLMLKKSWLNYICSLAIKDSEAAQKEYLSFPTSKVILIILLLEIKPNICFDVPMIGKCQNLSN